MALSDTQSQGFRSNVGNNFGSTESKMLLLLPHYLTSWVAASPGQRGGAKHCVIRRGRAGLGGEQEERARGSGEKKSGLQSPLPPQHCAAPQVPASFLSPPRHLPAPLPLLPRAQQSSGLAATMLGGTRVPVPGSIPWVCVPTHALLCTGSSKGRGKSAPAFPRLRTVPVLAASSAGEEER